MRNTKKYWKMVTAIVMMIVLALLFVACDGECLIKQKVEIGMHYGFVQSEDGSSINPDKTLMLTKFNVGETYYMVIDFSITTVGVSIKTNEITFKIKFENVDKLSGTIEDANTGKTTEMIVRDGEGNKGKEATVTFSVPSKAKKTVEKRVIIKLIPETQEDTAISAVFEGKNVEIQGDGRDGFTKNISSTKVQIETPQLRFDEKTGMLRWYHVEHAAYYKLVVDGVATEHKYEVDSDNVMAGTELTWALSELGLTHEHSIQIVACSDTTDYPQSNPSNAVDVNL